MIRIKILYYKDKINYNREFPNIKKTKLINNHNFFKNQFTKKI
jgi:HD superfamily phosphohydrolase YqeK